MRGCAELGACVGGLVALAHVQIDVGLQGGAVHGHRLGGIAQEHPDCFIALALRRQPGDDFAGRQVILPGRIDCVRQALLLAGGNQRLIGFPLLRIELRLLLDGRGILRALCIGGREQECPSVRPQPLADLGHAAEDLCTR